MSKKTAYILGILFTITLGAILSYFFCCNCLTSENDGSSVLDEKVEAPIINELASSNDFVIADANGDFNLTMEDNIKFRTSSFLIVQPVSDNIKNGIGSLKDYLKDNPSKSLEITGFYKSDEANNSAYPNLGMARSNAIKNYFVLQGVSSKLIDTKGKLNDAMVPNAEDILVGPQTLNILTGMGGNSVADTELQAACDAIKANPLVLYFKPGQAAISLTAAQRQKIADISRCVDKMGVKVQVIGHTDSKGPAANNLNLGQGRADFAKDYLSKNGILEQNIIATSKGEKEPIADNATPEGRSKNRRTVITIN